MRTVFALAILFLPISVLSLTAQTGSLKGIVRTADSGKIIVGARVYVHIGGLRHRTDSTSVERDSTRTDERGEFFFAHIPVGSHALIVAAERSDGESPDYHFLAVRIEEDSVEEVVVNLERRKILSGTITQRSESHSFPIYRGIPYRNIYDIYSARTDIADVVALDPNGGRFVPRYYVDHRLISNPFQTLFESSPPELYPFPPLFALEGYRDGIEIPAWGNDLSYDHLALDRVNLRMQSGSDWESISGAFNVRTEVVPLFGSGGEITVSKLGESGDTTLPAVDAIGTGSKLYEFSLLGPIYKDSASSLSFHVAGRYNQFDHYGQNYELYDMSDAFASERAEKSAQLGLHALSPTNLGRLANTSAYTGYLFGQLDFSVGKSQLKATGQLGQMRGALGNWFQYYMLDNPLVYNPESDEFTSASDDLYRERDHQTLGQNLLYKRGDVNYTWSDPNTTFSLGGGYTLYKTESGRRIGNRSYRAFDLWKMETPLDDRDITEGVQPFFSGNGSNGRIDLYEEPEEWENLRPNPLTAFHEGSTYFGAGNNPYGLTSTFFPTHGSSRGFDYREAEEWRGSGSFSTFVSGTLRQIEAGAHFSQWTLRRHQNSLPWGSDPFYDVYGSRGFYWNADTTGIYERFFDQPRRPLSLAFYSKALLDIYFNGFPYYLKLKPEIRVDFFDPNAPVQTILNYPLTNLDTLSTAPSKTAISSTLEVILPYEANWEVFLRGGVLQSLPSFSYLYDNAYPKSSTGGQLVGNPDLDFLTTYSLELGGGIYLFDRYLAKASLYYVRGEALELQLLPSLPEKFVTWTEARSQSYGFAASISGTLAEHVGIEANYRLQRIEQEFYNNYSNTEIIVIAPYTIDRTHRLNASLLFRWDKGEGGAIGNVKLLENVVASLSGQFLSGTPYTEVNSRGDQLSGINGLRYPSQILFDVHVEKGFLLKDFVGDWADQLALSFYIDIKNLLNNTTSFAVFPWAIDPTKASSGNLVRDLGSFAATPLFRDEDLDRPETVGVDQYDRYGNRLYSPYADADLDGIVTQREKYEAYKRFAYTQMNRRIGDQYPRQVWFGMKLRF